jgi:hypothetical protein
MQVLIAMGVRLNGRGKRSVAPGSVLEYMKTGELHLRTPAGDIRCTPLNPPHAMSVGQG